MEQTTSCHCCEGLSVQTPVEILNRPGLNAIAYRVGTQPQFKHSLLSGLTLSGQPALFGLTTRNDDDFSIALLDAWSVVSDVLTFYQERIANESYLRTATERLSVQEMARLTGYELGPGVAASTFLSFTLNDSPGALGPILNVAATPAATVDLPPVTIPVGTQVKSIPAPGEQAQTFETVEEIVANASWNIIRPQQTQPQILTVDSKLLFLSGTSLGIKQGDVLLINAGGSSIMVKVLKVTQHLDLQTTQVDLSDNVSLPQFNQQPEGNPGQILIVLKVFNTAAIKTVTNKVWNQSDLNAYVKIQRWSPVDFKASIQQLAVTPQPIADQNVYIFRKRASVFGYNAPLQIVPNISPTTWVDQNLKNEFKGTLWLDSVYDEILPNSFIGVQLASGQAKSDLGSSFVIPVQAADSRSRTEYGISAKATVVSFNNSGGWAQPVDNTSLLSDLRGLTVYCQSELLNLPQIAIPDFVQGNKVVLDGYYDGLFEGQHLMLTGNVSDPLGVTASELVTILSVGFENISTVLTFTAALQNVYIRTSVTMNGNIARATNGATVSEILGSGDATQIFQTFKLKQGPLTYISADTTSGNKSSLSVRVNDLLWQEVPFFFGHAPDEMIFITTRDNLNNTSVKFGDGITGLRPMSGQNNIKASYRIGIGFAAEIQPNQLSQLLSAPPGVKSAINSLGPDGAEDPENIDDAKTNATLKIKTLDRVVSLQDYEDFARSFSGIGKSLATWTWNGQRRSVFLTVAGSGGTALDLNSDLSDNLKDAFISFGDPNVHLTIASYQATYFHISGKLLVDPQYIPKDVVAQISAVMQDKFSFEQRSFGQPVTYGEVEAVIQNVPGVVAVDIQKFFITGTDPGSGNPPALLIAKLPQPGLDSAFPAELLTLDPRPLDLNITTHDLQQ
jgi:hypothetical protein